MVAGSAGGIMAIVSNRPVRWPTEIIKASPASLRMPSNRPPNASIFAGSGVLQRRHMAKDDEFFQHGFVSDPRAPRCQIGFGDVMGQPTLVIRPGVQGVQSSREFKSQEAGKFVNARGSPAG